MQRPDFIAHWQQIEDAEGGSYSDSKEVMSISASFGSRFGLKRIGIHHERVPPGRRTSYPHAESTEEEFVFVLEGSPDVWIDGELHRLREGEGVVFVPGTGVAHTFINNTDVDVRLMVVGETARDDNRIQYPLHADRNAMRKDHWIDWPGRLLGNHDGLPDRLRDSDGPF